MARDGECRFISVFGEWCGGNIQKNVAICNLPKTFFVFAALLTGPGDRHTWLDSSALKAGPILNVDDYGVFSIEVDFSRPELAQNELADLTQAVEDKCPVAAAFGFPGLGEGIVWTADFKRERLRFKVKGEKHSATKVKTIAKVDTEKVASAVEFVESVVTKNRVEQVCVHISLFCPKQQ